MKSNQELIAELLKRFDEGQPLDEKEKRMLEAWFEMMGDPRVMRNLRAEEQWMVKRAMGVEGLAESNPPMEGAASLRRPMRWIRLVAAAAVMIVCWGSWWLMRPVQRPQAGKVAVGVEAGRLELIDASRINFGRLRVGAIISRRGACVISKGENDELVFQRQEGATGDEGWYRVLSGKRAIQLQLPDQSMVRLDAGSSIQFPQEVRVGDKDWKLSGRALFDITKAPDVPLVIQLPDGSSIQVLGTCFIAESSGQNSVTRVCLFSGSVRMANRDDSIVLRPSQMVAMAGGRVELQDMRDSSRPTGWARLNASFRFENTPLAEVLRQVSAWYICSVSNPAKIRGITITGSMSKAESLERTLAAIERAETGHVRLKLLGSVILVHPY